MIDDMSRNVLAFINQNGETDIESIERFLNNDISAARTVLDFLKTEGYIRGVKRANIGITTIKVEYFPPYKITQKGISCLFEQQENIKEKEFNHFHIWTNTIIAIFALVVSVIALILSA